MKTKYSELSDREFLAILRSILEEIPHGLTDWNIIQVNLCAIELKERTSRYVIKRKNI